VELEMELSALLTSFFAFVGVMAGAYGIAGYAGGGSRSVQSRLAKHTVQIQKDEVARRERVNILKGQEYSRFAILDRLLRRLKAGRTAHRELVRAHASITVMQYFLIRWALASVLGSMLYLVGGLPLALVGDVLGFAVPRITIKLIGRRRHKRFEAQLAEAIDLLVGALRSGHGFLQGLEAVSRDMGGPMHEELVTVMEQVSVGTSPVEALQAMSERIESYDLTMFVSAVAIQRTAGGNLAEVLENIANTVRERRRIRGEVHAITTGPRVSSYVLSAIPIGLLCFFSATGTEYRQVMFTSPMGQIMIGFSVIWSMLGLFFTSKVAKVEY
jgi:tight adherence protein B